MSKKEMLETALKTQFEDVDTGTDGQNKKQSVETLKILYELSMAQDKADEDSEFRESEMELKEREMALKEREAEVAIELKKKELEIKDREFAIRKSENLMHGIEVGIAGGSLISVFAGQKMYKDHFNKIYEIETTKPWFVPSATRALSYMKNMERFAIQGAKIIFRH